MITYLAKIVNFLALFFQNIVTFTSYIGQVIVLTVSFIITFVYSSIKYIILFLQIIYEDNISIFTEDLPGLINNICNTFIDYYYNVCKISIAMGNEVNNQAYYIFNNVKLSVSGMLLIIYEVLSRFKNAVIFLGDTLWLLLTFVPLHLPDLICALFQYIRDVIVTSTVNTYMALLKVTNFLSDVPLQSFLGILMTMVIGRLCIHFREIIQFQTTNIYWTSIRKITYLYYVIYHYLTNSEVRMITQIVGGQPVVSRDLDLQLENEDDAANAAEALCVICQERQKCVLTLPCRHVCLCTECCMRLYGYQRTCPICRTFIYHSVTVYL